MAQATNEETKTDTKNDETSTDMATSDNKVDDTVDDVPATSNFKINKYWIDHDGNFVKIALAGGNKITAQWLSNERPTASGVFNGIGKDNYVDFPDDAKFTFKVNGNDLNWSNNTVWKGDISGLCCGLYIIPSTKDKLLTYLKAAMALELSTLPLYITAWFSFINFKNRDPITTPQGLLRSIILEEMVHMNIVSNIISSIYTTDEITTEFNIKFGKNSPLPAHVRSDLTDTSLQPYSKDLLYNVFIQIEAPTTLTKESSKIINGRYPFEPENGKDSVELSFIRHDAYNEIGEFYNSIKKGLTNLYNNKKIDFKNDDTHKQGTYITGAVTVKSLKDALHGIDIICDQGEGFRLKDGSWSEYVDDHKNNNQNKNPEKSHFVRFIELLVGKELLSMNVVKDKTDDKILTYKFVYGTNSPFKVNFGTEIYPIKNFKTPAPDKLFNDNYVSMLKNLTQGLQTRNVMAAVGQMFGLQKSFVKCMDTGTYPDFSAKGFQSPPNVDVVV